MKEVFAAFAARDPERVVAVLDPDVVFIAVTGGVVGRTEPYRGYEGMREYFRDVGRVWDELVLTPREFEQVRRRDPRDRRVSARSPSRMISGSTGWVWRVRDGRVVYGRVYASAAEAIEAVRRAEALGPPLRPEQVVDLLLLAHDHVLEPVLDRLRGGLAAGRLDRGLERLERLRLVLDQHVDGLRRGRR